MAVIIRPATPVDTAAMLEIYRPYVEETVISFELETPSITDFERRIVGAQQRWAWLVAEEAGRILGYASATPHRSRAAYRFSTETSVYVAQGSHRRGLGRLLYRALIETVRARGACQAYAGITMPNSVSVAFHRSFGFEPVGVFTAVGWKFAAWHDVSWWQLRLREGPPSV